MEVALKMFVEQSLRFGALCGGCGVAGKGTGAAQSSLDQAVWGLWRGFQGF